MSVKQNIICKTYDNILEMYNENPDYKRDVDSDKCDLPHRTFDSYLDDYGDDEYIVHGVLCDTLDTDVYNFKVSRHRYWRNKKVTITLK